MPLLGATVTDATLDPEGRLRMALYDHTGTTYALDLQLAALVNVTVDKALRALDIQNVKGFVFDGVTINGEPQPSPGDGAPPRAARSLGAS